MRIVRSVSEMQKVARHWQGRGLSLALVPTMGYLHEGHLSLMREGARHADLVVVSIFVNPTQFGPGEDLDSYPRDFEGDCAKCREAGVDLVFAPTDFYAPNHSTWVTEESLSLPLCGRARPGHFRGVTTVVSKLFHACLPDVAVFGQKDAQQSLVIRRMVRDLDFPVRIVVAPIVREEDGLALSSRNKYLSPDDRRRALAIRRGLDLAEAAFAAGEREAANLRGLVVNEICRAEGRVDYVELVGGDDLAPLETVDREALLAVAAHFGPARLLDNTLLQP